MPLPHSVIRATFNTLNSLPAESCQDGKFCIQMSNAKELTNGMIAGSPLLPVPPPLPEILLPITKISMDSTNPTKAHPSASARVKQVVAFVVILPHNPLMTSDG